MDPWLQLVLTIIAGVVTGAFGLAIKKTEGNSQVQSQAQAAVISHATEIFEAAMRELRAENADLKQENKELRKGK